MKKRFVLIVAFVAGLFGIAPDAQAQNIPYPAQSAPQMGSMIGPTPYGVSPVGYSAAAAHQQDGCNDCAVEGWTACNYAYGGFMYLRPRDAEIAYAVPANGPIAPGAVAVQAGPVRVLDLDFQPGFFVGFGKFLDECSSFGVQYTNFEGNTRDAVTVNAPLVVRSLVAHPSTFSGALDGLTASGSQTIQYEMIDFDYRNLIAYDFDYKINYLVGLRLAQMEQAFNSTFQFNGTHNVTTDLDFYGAGIRLGLEGERYTSNGFMVYGKTYASFIPGEFRADYDQTHSNNVIRVDTAWTAGRLVTMLDLEVGGGWVSCCGNWRATVGYTFNSWLNVVQTDEWIKGVQTNNFVDMTDKMTFDGFVARIECRW